MAKVCHVCKKGPSFGNTRSHSMVATRRRFDPNLDLVSLDPDNHDPDVIPDHPGSLRTPGVGPAPLPNHPGKILKPEPGIPLPDRSGRSMGDKIGKDLPQ